LKKTTTVVSRMPITQARINLGQLAKRVHLNKEYFILEKDGIPVIGLMDAAELEDYLELQDSTAKEFIAESHKDYVAGRTRPAEELLAQLKQQAPKTAQGRRRVKL
jgi:hypothetical protein